MHGPILCQDDDEPDFTLMNKRKGGSKHKIVDPNKNQKGGVRAKIELEKPQQNTRPDQG